MKKLSDECIMLVELLDSCNDKLIITPDDIGTRRLRSVIYMVAELYDKAITDLNTIIKGGHQDITAYYQRGGCYFDKGEYDLAKRDYLRALKIQFEEDTEFVEGFTEVVISTSTMETEKEKKDIEKILEHEKQRVISSYLPDLK